MSDHLVTRVARSRHPALESYYVRDVLEAFAVRVNAKKEKEEGDRRVWADYRTIAADCERASSAVREAVKILTAAGLLDDTGEREGETRRVKVFRVMPDGLEGHRRRREWRNAPEGLAHSNAGNEHGGGRARRNAPDPLADLNAPEGLAENAPESLAANAPEGLENPHTPYKEEHEKEQEKEQEIPPNGALAPGRVRGPGSSQGEDPVEVPRFHRTTLKAAADLEADWLADMAALGRSVAAVTRRAVAATLPEVIGGASFRGWLKRKHVVGDGDVTAAMVAAALWDAWRQIRLSPEHVAGGWGLPWLLHRPIKTAEHAMAWRERVAREAQPNHVAAVAVVAWWAEERQARGMAADLTAADGLRALNGLLADVARDDQRETSVAWIKRRLEAALDDGDAAIGALCRSRDRLASIRPKRPRSTDGIGGNMPAWATPQAPAAATSLEVGENFWESTT